MSEATTDRELLELAAKAFWADEIDDACSIRWLELDQAIGYTHGDNQDHNGQDQEFVWNPLADDGDSRRLQVACEIDLTFHEAIAGDYVKAQAAARSLKPVLVPIHGAGPLDNGAACRLAVLRVAAAIGKEMK